MEEQPKQVQPVESPPAAEAGASLAIHTAMGSLIAPWLTGKAGRMNPVAVFVGVLAWGWLRACGVCCWVFPS